MEDSSRVDESAVPLPPPFPQTSTDAVSGQYNMMESGKRSRFPRSGKVMIIALLVLVLILAASAGSYTYYTVTRPKPVMTISSLYHVDKVPAGSQGTRIQVQGNGFTPSSPITLLVDQVPLKIQGIKSDEQGRLKTEIEVSGNWKPGKHSLLAKDKDGYMPQQAASFLVVKQGQAHTPGPHGSPPDDASYKLKVKLDMVNEFGNKVNTDIDFILIVTGKPDPAGGSVCSEDADGKPHVKNYPKQFNMTTTTIYSCEGTYKAGRIDYTQMITDVKMVFAGYSNETNVCVNKGEAFLYHHLIGTFNDAKTITGTLARPHHELICDRKGARGIYYALNGTWKGVLL